MSANGIAHLATKELRQKAKLDIAKAKRQGKVVADDGTVTGSIDPTKNYYRSRNNYDITELPTQYDDNGIIDNPNVGGLIVGRPWVSAPVFNLPSGMSEHEPLEGSGGNDPTVPGSAYLSAAASGINAAYGTRGTPYDPGGAISSVPNSASGLYRTKYLGNVWSTYGAFSEFDVTWFDDPLIGPIGTDVYGYAGFGQRQDLDALPTLEDGYTLHWQAYVQVPTTGTYNIWTSGTDDDAAVWIGNAAYTPTYANMNGYASNNRVLSLNSVKLVGGQWYPMRMVFTEFGGWEQCQWFLQNSTTGVLYNGTDLTWAYDTSVNGINPSLTTPPFPVVQLDAGDIRSYSGSGSTWTNITDNTAYTINAGSYSSGNGGYINFNGFSTYVDIGNPISTNGNFTKEAWVSPQSLSGGHVIIGSYSNRLFFNNTNLQCSANGSNILIKTGVSTGWQHVVATFDDTTNTATLYINGVQVVQNTNITAHYTVTHAERVGSDTDTTGTTGANFFGGKIAIARVYDYAIDSTTVLANFNAEKARFGL